MNSPVYIFSWCFTYHVRGEWSQHVTKTASNWWDSHRLISVRKNYTREVNVGACFTVTRSVRLFFLRDLRFCTIATKNFCARVSYAVVVCHTLLQSHTSLCIDGWFLILFKLPWCSPITHVFVRLGIVILCKLIGNWQEKCQIFLHVDTYLTVVGKISGAYRKTVPNDPVIPNLPIMLNVIISGRRLVPFDAVKESAGCVWLRPSSPSGTDRPSFLTVLARKAGRVVEFENKHMQYDSMFYSWHGTRVTKKTPIWWWWLWVKLKNTNMLEISGKHPDLGVEVSLV